VITRANSEDEKLALVAYLASKIGTSPATLVGQMPYEIVATTDRAGKPNGAVMYINWRGSTIEMACAGEPGWLTRAHLAELFRYPFEQMRCWTVLTLVRRRNARARQFNVKVGFTELCVVRNGPDKSEDSILYGMSRPECRWLPCAEAINRQSAIANGAHASRGVP
jgi:hypothetical protein